jgi:hypothetical protein
LAFLSDDGRTVEQGGDDVAKRAGLVGIFGVALLIFLIWNDPQGAAGQIGDFFGWIGHVLSEAWHKLAEFIGSLAGTD